jgi:hypothetical protein
MSDSEEKKEVELGMLKEEFGKVILKYNLKDEKRTQEIADYLTKDRKNRISAEGFARKFRMDIRDAKVFLSFIVKGIEFKERRVDKKRD